MNVWVIIGGVIALVVIHRLGQAIARTRNRALVLAAAHNIPDFTPTYTVGSAVRGISVDSSRKKVALLVRYKQGGVSHQVFPFSDVLACEIVENGLTVMKADRLSQVGGALVGGALFGSVGALGGALSGKRTVDEKVQSIVLAVTVNSLDTPRHEVWMMDDPAGVEKDSITYRNARNFAEEWHSRLNVIIYQGGTASHSAATAIVGGTEPIVALSQSASSTGLLMQPAAKRKPSAIVRYGGGFIVVVVLIDLIYGTLWLLGVVPGPGG